MAQVLVDPMLMVFLIILLSVTTFLAIVGLGLGWPVIKGRLPGEGAFYILYGAVTKFGYTKNVLGNTLIVPVGKSKLKFIVNPAHRTYLWGKPLYILSVEYGSSIKPSMWAILTALKELGKDDLVKRYLDLNYSYVTLADALSRVTTEKEAEEIENALKQIEQELKNLENELRAVVDENAHVVEVKDNLKLEELSTDKQVLVVRQLDPELIGEYANGVSAPKLSANMDLYAMHMSSIFKSDVVKMAFAAMFILIGIAVLYMVLHGQGKPPQVNIQLTPEMVKQLANETAKNATRVVHV